MRACAHVRVYVCVYVRVSVIKTLNQLNKQLKLKNSKNFVAKKVVQKSFLIIVLNAFGVSVSDTR